jgi:hypothetical protein
VFHGGRGGRAPMRGRGDGGHGGDRGKVHAKSSARRVMPPCAATNGSRPTTMVKRRLRGIH